MGPHADDFHCLDIIHHLIYKARLDIDSAGASAGKITNELFVWRWRLIGILGQNFQKPFRLRLQTGPAELLRVAAGLISVDQYPTHQSSSFLHFSTGVFHPLIIESLMPGIEFR